ncbi:MAG: hypothetical protein CL920_07645 [Deltaproteobacteria bacterium]|nr:hypothetical protein [Deltaproteobacteria bacterium]MBU48552.1 hypothetical protein [Deltaproteobacteria bacterium]|tara:strand:+ start:4928 stop:6841 length:1914 start_codon:yes stop_codon:yes gene_type:complete
MNRRLWYLWFSLALLFLTVGACDCGVDALKGVTLDVKLLKPTPGPVSGKVPFEVSVSPDDATRFVVVQITPQALPGKVAETRRIAELHKKPYTFEWNSFQVPDGFYRVQAIAYDEGGGEHLSTLRLIQVSNEPPRMWFVNCHDGQFIRGIHSLVVSVSEQETLLSGAPKLFVNSIKGPETLDSKAPYRFLVSTLTYADGERLSVAAEGEDYKGNRRRIRCFPIVDNTAPTVQFREPAQSDVLLGKKFTVKFDAYDRFGVREVRLWVDGVACQKVETQSTNLSQSEEQGECQVGYAPLVGRDSPLFPIEVSLSDAYKTEQPIVLTARAVDLAGNISEPAAQLRVRVDPVVPEIFIRSPGQSELLWTSSSFTARITDNHLLEKVELFVKAGGKKIALLEKVVNQSEFTPSVDVSDVRKKFGYGKHSFVVRATDKSGNVAERTRLFLVGCGDSTDCPVGKVCHRYQCLTPAGLNEPCNTNTPCAIGLACTPGSLPVCSSSAKGSFCRQRCNPGNKFVSSDACPPTYYCSKSLKVCMPGDPCVPLVKENCGAGKHCVPADDDAGMCVPIGNVANGKACGENCSASGNCRRGSWCVYLLNLGTTSCMKACLLDNPRCPTGSRCSPLQWSFGGGKLQYGVCSP